MLKILLTSLLLGRFWQPAPAPTPAPPTEFLRQFVLAIINTQLDERAIAEKYMCPSLLSGQGEKADKRRAVYFMMLAGQRKALRDEKMDPREITIVPFDPLAILPSVLVEEDTRQVYMIRYRGKGFFPLLMRGDRLDSFTIFGKDNGKSFIPYCE